jgi:hypothetical protein
VNFFINAETAISFSNWVSGYGVSGLTIAISSFIIAKIPIELQWELSKGPIGVPVAFI